VLELKLPNGWHVQFWQDQVPARTFFSSALAIIAACRCFDRSAF